MSSFQPGGFINTAAFTAKKGNGPEGDIAIDELHFVEHCIPEKTFCKYLFILPHIIYSSKQNSAVFTGIYMTKWYICASTTLFRISDCPENYTNCGDGMCIPKAQRCNCERNCANNADEIGCNTALSEYNLFQNINTGFRFSETDKYQSEIIEGKFLALLPVCSTG